MARVDTSLEQQVDLIQISPEYVRISTAAAIALGLTPGQIYRDAACGCINLIQTYPVADYAQCANHAFAQERADRPEVQTGIRDAWPRYRMAEVIAQIAVREEISEVGRVCISQVHDTHSYPDLLALIDQMHAVAPRVPIAALLSAEVLDADKLYEMKMHGVDTVGICLDGAREEIFQQIRAQEGFPAHTWASHWRIARLARIIFGPFKVNLHLIVGMGETDRDLVALFHQLRAEQIAAYLFAGNPVPDAPPHAVSCASLTRYRRIQLAKFLIEECALPLGMVHFDEAGAISAIHCPAVLIEAGIASGQPFMANGCLDRHGRLSCNRPTGLAQPDRPCCDYPVVPNAADVALIRAELGITSIDEDEIVFAYLA